MEQGAVAAAVQQAGKVLEAFLRELFRELLPKLPPGEAANVNYALERIGKGKPAERLTLGELVQVLQEGQVIQAAVRHLKRRLDLLENEKLVRDWVELRNRAAHADKPILETEAEAFLKNLKLLLQQAGVLREPQPLKRLPSWWEVITPHRDIREGRTEASRFAAKLDEVVAGRANPEYLDPQTFFARTHVTLGLRNLLFLALRRLSGQGGDGVLHIETAFGGGKTHSLIALYHFFGSGQDFSSFFWAQTLLEEARVERVPKARVLTFVGTEADPLGPTPWGLFAQALGKYERIKSYDENRQAPGKAVLRELLGEEPTLILVDEIAEFLCRLVQPEKLAKGREKEARAYQSQVLTFVHELTEVAGELPRCLLVLTTTTSTAYGEEGERVQHHLRTIVGRMQRLLEPVGSADIYEVVRARLFEDLGDPEIHEAVAEAFFRMYREPGLDLPEEAKEPAYREKIVRAYPFHPELIDVLYNQWGSFPNFQRTRGVLRFLALVVQEAWQKRQPSPLLRLCDVPLGHPELRQFLLACVGKHYDSVLSSDIAGGREIARRLDQSLPEEYRRYRLAEGLATAIFLYSFSGAQKPERGASAGRLRLAALTPEIPAAAVADTLEKLEASLHYLHRRDHRYYFSTELNLNRAIAEAEEVVEEAAIREEIRKALEKRVGTESPILEREVWPSLPEKVAERRDRHVLVVLAPEFPHGSEKTEEFVKTLFAQAGSGYRAFPGALLGLAPDREEFLALRQRVRRLLALREVQRTRAAELSAEDREKLVKDLRHAEDDVADLVPRVWRHLALWGGAQGVEWIPLAPYARAGLTLASLVVEHLRNANRLSEKLAPEILLWYVPLQEGRAYKEVWEAFLRTPGMPIVAERTVREAVREGVRAGVFGLRVDDEIYFGREVPAAYLDEAELIPAELAASLVGKREEKPPAPPPAPEPDKGPPLKPQTRRKYQLIVKVPSDRLSDFVRGVILPLQRATDEVEVEIHVRAKREEGIPEDVVEHKVRETLRQL
ncbi:MAG: DUF499 domain-containing protein, partial [Candidatus Bipolaricaulaceae bacterium]